MSQEHHSMDAEGIFKKHNNIANLISKLLKYKDKDITIIFKQGDEVVDTMETTYINEQHLYYDIFENQLIFGNSIHLRLNDINRLETFMTESKTRFTLHYKEDKDSKSVTFVHAN